MTQEEILNIKGDLCENLILYDKWLEHLMKNNLVERSIEAIDWLSRVQR